DDQATACCLRRRARKAKAPQPKSSPGNPAPAIGPGTGTAETSTGPVLPFGASTSATKRFARLFGAVTSAIVALRTVKPTAPPKPVGPFPQVGQLIPKVKFPVPSPLKAPVAATKAGTCAPTTISVNATPMPLNLKI